MNFTIEDIDECSNNVGSQTDLCPNGQCQNTNGDYNCVCSTGYRNTANRKECVGQYDIDIRQQSHQLMDDSSYRLNFDLGKKNEIHRYSQKEHLKISKIANFGREML